MFDVSCKTCYDQNKTFNGDKSVPNFVSVRPARECSYTGTAFEIHDTFDLHQALNYYITKSWHFLFFGHSSTKEFREVAECTQQADFVFVKTTATCSSYTAELDTYDFELSADFQEAVRTLPIIYSANNLEPFHDFVYSFGTHFIKKATMGGSVTQTSKFAADQFAAMKSEFNDINNAALLSMFNR